VGVLPSQAMLCCVKPANWANPVTQFASTASNQLVPAQQYIRTGQGILIACAIFAVDFLEGGGGFEFPV
jgi:hypothetical protein